LLKRNQIPDIVTDQTSAHDYLAYFPHHLSFENGRSLRDANPAEFAPLGAVYGPTMRRHGRLPKTRRHRL
jgi:urocanate hydratase